MKRMIGVLVPDRFQHGELRTGGMRITVTCDHEGCTEQAKASGYEMNGPRIEALYGLPGWHLGCTPDDPYDYCEGHAPVAEEY